MVYHGHVANGAIQLDPDVILPEGAEVQVAVLGQREPVTGDAGNTLTIGSNH